MHKYKKGVSAEAIADHGYDAAVQLTDDQFLFELQGEVLDGFTPIFRPERSSERQVRFRRLLPKRRAKCGTSGRR
jgi:hypothetical protein